jgi:CRP-like cAMP-binding protein
VRKSGFWGLLGDGERESLKSASRSRTFSDGALLCLQGEPTTHVFILLSGWVKIITVADDGREMLAALRGPGAIVGEIAQVTGYRTATVQAFGSVRALIVGAERFEAFLDSHIPAARAYRHFMTEYQLAVNSSQRDLATSSGPRRLAALLLDLDGMDLPLSQEELASLIGSARSTVTRALSDWRSRHIISTRQRPVTILDQPALRRIAGR